MYKLDAKWEVPIIVKNLIDIGFSTNGSALKSKVKALFVLFVLIGANAFAQEKITISGNVSDESGSLPGVAISTEVAGEGTVTDIDGNFNLSVAKGSTLNFSYIGYVTKSMLVETSMSDLKIVLKPNVTALEEIVVVGYGTLQKKDVTGATKSIDTESFQAQPVINVDQVLQGRAAGVQVNVASGAPGQNLRVRVRGTNSINLSNEPLYVVDGVILPQGRGIRDINPTDIKDIQVLKDASSTALYGNRGANGVVLITTKGGSFNSKSIDIEISSGVAEVPRNKYIDVYTDANEYLNDMTRYSEAIGRNGILQGITQDSINSSYPVGSGTDWQDEMLRQASFQKYQISVSGGSDKVKTYTSLGYVDQQGVIINSDYKRFTLRNNLRYDVSDFVSMNLNASLSRDVGHNNSGGTRMVGAATYSPHIPVRNEDGTWGRDPWNQATLNPIAESTEDNSDVVTDFIMARAGITVKPIDGLSIDSYVSVDWNEWEQRRFATGNTSWAATNGPKSQFRNNVTYNIQNTNMLNYKRDLFSSHRLDLTLVNEIAYRRRDDFRYREQNIPNDYFGANNFGGVAAEDGSTNFSIVESQLVSWLGRLNYSIDDKYTFTVSGRRDGSSKFQNQKFGTFVSGAFLWRLSEENFLKNVDPIDNLSFRLSYGQTGNESIPAYETLGTLSNDIGDQSYSYDNSAFSTGFGLDLYASPTLNWETTSQTNIGFDLSLFDGAVDLTFDWFRKITEDLLFQQDVEPFVGGGQRWINLGEVSNQGVDISLGLRPFQRGKFTWNSNINLSYIKNQVEKLPAGDVFQQMPAGWSGLVGGTRTFLIREGHPLNTHYLLDYQGVWQESEADLADVYRADPGDPKYRDVNNDSVINAADRIPMGSATPDFTWGWNNTFSYSNFSVNVFLVGALNRQVYNNLYFLSATGRANRTVPNHKDFTNFWSPENTETDIPQDLANRNLGISDYVLQKADFIRIQNVSLSYKVPNKVIGFSDVTLAMSIQNLATITDYRGYDPEANSSVSNDDGDTRYGFDAGSYPVPRTTMFSIKAKF